MHEEWRNRDGSVNYGDYMSSEDWRRFRESYFRRHRYAICSRCGIDNAEHKKLYSTRLHLNHRTYKNLGCEQDNDLEPICKPCHDIEHSGHSATERLMAVLGEEANTFSAAFTSGTNFTCNAKSPEVYWRSALEAVRQKRAQIPDDGDERTWAELERLQKLEDYVRFCLSEA